MLLPQRQPARRRRSHLDQRSRDLRSSLADPNVDLANDLSLLSVTSQLAVSTVLYRPNKWSVHYRTASFYAYVCLLVISTIVQQVGKRRLGNGDGGRQEGQHELGGRTTNWIFLVVVVSYAVWASLLVDLADSSRGRKILAELSKGSSNGGSFLGAMVLDAQPQAQDSRVEEIASFAHQSHGTGEQTRVGQDQLVPLNAGYALVSHVHELHRQFRSNCCGVGFGCYSEATC